LWAEGNPKGALMEALQRSTRPLLSSGGGGRGGVSVMITSPLHDILGAVCGLSIEEDSGAGGLGLGGGALSTVCPKVSVPHTTGGGTGVFETLGLNLEGAGSVCECAKETLVGVVGGDRGGGKHLTLSQLLSLIVSLHTASAVLRAFSSVLRSILLSTGGGCTTQQQQSSLSAALAKALDAGGGRLDLGGEDRARRAHYLLTSLESVRTFAGRFIRDGGLPGVSPSPTGGTDLCAAQLLKSLSAAARQYTVIFDSWIRAI